MEGQEGSRCVRSRCIHCKCHFVLVVSSDSLADHETSQGTCHSDHIPPFVKHRSSFQEKGIDVLVVVNANDFFVNNAWRGVQDVTDQVRS